MIVSLIVAASQNGVIGRDNRLPWRLPADLAYFKHLTMGYPVLMGRKTHQSIGKPLPGRTNIVVTGQPDYQAEGCLLTHSIEAALEFCRDETEIFVIGGATIYQQMLARAHKIYLTVIYHDFEGDTFLFAYDKSDWAEVSRADCEPDEKNKYAYSFLVLERQSSPGT